MNTRHGFIALVGLILLLAGLMWYFAATANPVPPLPWESSEAAALEAAAARDALVLVDVYADWCGPCQQMTRETYADPRVRAALESYVLLKIDSDTNPEAAIRLGSGFLPTTAVMRPDGEVLAKRAGFLDADAFLRFLAENRPRE